MTKVMITFCVREGTDIEKLMKAWHEEHVPPILKRPGLKKYFINWVKESLRGEKFYGIVEFWYESYEAAKAAFEKTINSTPDGFSKNLYHVSMMIVEEVVVKDEIGK